MNKLKIADIAKKMYKSKNIRQLNGLSYKVSTLQNMISVWLSGKIILKDLSPHLQKIYSAIDEIIKQTEIDLINK